MRRLAIHPANAMWPIVLFAGLLHLKICDIKKGNRNKQTDKNTKNHITKRFQWNPRIYFAVQKNNSIDTLVYTLCAIDFMVVPSLFSRVQQILFLYLQIYSPIALPFFILIWKWKYALHIYFAFYYVLLLAYTCVEEIKSCTHWCRRIRGVSFLFCFLCLFLLLYEIRTTLICVWTKQ